MDTSLRDAYRHCARVTRARAANFYPAFLTLPPAKRRALFAIYTFCRRLDDAVDDPPGGAEGADPEALRALSLGAVARVERLIPPGDRRPEGTRWAEDRPIPPEDRPLGLALADAAARYRIPPRYLREIAAGVRMDLDIRRYPDFRSLRRYCFRVASAVGLVALQVFGYRRKRARARAVELGLGMQLANIVRDVREDIARDRIYLPREDLDRFGVDEGDLARRARAGGLGDGPAARRVRALLAFEAERARRFLHRGLRLLPYLPRHSRPCPAILGHTYLAVLGRIERRGFDVFGARASLSGRAKAALALRRGLGALVRPGGTG